MSNNSTIAWLIPCFNEEITVAKVVDDIKKYCPDAHIYVYDNNSTDKTAEIAQERGAIVKLEPRQGKGFVVSSMVEDIDADYYIMVDGDDTYDIQSWEKLIAPLKEGYAMAVGRRISTDKAKSYRLFHRFGNRLISTLLSLSFGQKINDALSGYRAFTRTVAKGVPLYAKGFEIETEFTVQVLENRYSIKEVDSPYGFRPEGSFSKLSTWNDGFLILYTILRLVKDYKPLTFFGIGSLIFIGIAGIGLFLDSELLTALSIGISVSFFLTGMILNAISQRSKEITQIMRR